MNTTAAAQPQTQTEEERTMWAALLRMAERRIRATEETTRPQPDKG